jgi:hypothetical protein
MIKEIKGIILIKIIKNKKNGKKNIRIRNFNGLIDDRIKQVF